MEIELELTARFHYIWVHSLFSVLSSLKEVVSGKEIEIMVEVGADGIR